MLGFLLLLSSLKHIKDIRPPDIAQVKSSHSSPARFRVAGRDVTSTSIRPEPGSNLDRFPGILLVFLGRQLIFSSQ
jgi:hypothetical protein